MVHPVSFCGDFQNIRFLWSVSMMNGWFVQMRYGLQCLRALRTAKNSLSYISYHCSVGVKVAE